MQRLDRFLSEAGVASRRELREIVRAGRVMVNGVVVRQPEQRINEVQDTICFDGRRIGAKKRTVLLLNKPMGYVTSTDDPRDRTVMELLAPQYRALFPVGRLDKETEGLLLFTDDGELAHRTMPSVMHRSRCATCSLRKPTATIRSPMTSSKQEEYRHGTNHL